MKVLHILSSLSIGGAENLVLDILPNSKNESYVLYSNESPGNRVDAFREVAQEVGYMPAGKGGDALKYVWKLAGYLYARSIQAVHVHNSSDASLAALAIKIVKVLSIGTCRPSLVMTAHGFNLKPEKVPMAGYLLKEIRRTLYVSDATLNFYRADPAAFRMIGGEKKAQVVYNGIDDSKIEEARPYDLSTIFPDGEELPVFIMVGNFNTDVRLQRLLCQACVFLSSQGKLPFRMLFAGGRNEEHPELFDDCRAMLKNAGLFDRVRLLGQRSDVYALIKACDGYVYASSADAFGLSVIEAMLCGKEVICSDIATFREITQDGRYAHLVPNTVEDFAGALLEYSRKYREKKESGLRGEVPDSYDFAKRTYSVSHTAANYDAVYDAVVKWK